MLILILGSLGLFTQLQTALNTIWQVKPKPGRGIWGAVKDRFLSFLLVLNVGALLVAALMVNAALSAVSGFFPEFHLPGGAFLWEALRWLVSMSLLTLLFATVYKILPDVKIGWRDVWVGAATTAVLFTIGNYLIGLYLGRSSVASTYGAAGSLVIILLWVYYSSQILLFGAEFTRVYAAKYGHPIGPSDNAIPMTADDCARRDIPSRRDPSMSAPRGS
jgi:membrane protein